MGFFSSAAWEVGQCFSLRFHVRAATTSKFPIRRFSFLGCFLFSDAQMDADFLERLRRCALTEEEGEVRDFMASSHVLMEYASPISFLLMIA